MGKPEPLKHALAIGLLVEADYWHGLSYYEMRSFLRTSRKRNDQVQGRRVRLHGPPASTFEALAKEVLDQALAVSVVKPVVHLTLHPTRPLLLEA